MSDSFGTPWTVAHQAPLSMDFPRQEYWGGLSFPSPGHLVNQGIKLTSPALVGGFFTNCDNFDMEHTIGISGSWVVSVQDEQFL